MRLHAALAAAVAVLLTAAPVLADHPGGLRSAGWSPMTAALMFGGLALLVGAVVVILVTVFTKRDRTDTPE